MKCLIRWVIIFFGSVGVGYSQLSFTSNGQEINREIGRGVVLGDFNNDGSLDAFVVNDNNYRIYFGDGQGRFTDSGQHLTKPDDASGRPAIFDINGDGRSEVITGSTVWLIDDQGHFTAQPLSIVSSETIELGTMRFADLNGDGYLDLFAFHNYTASRVYLNDGHGQFSDTEQRLGDGAIGSGQLAHIALGDIDGNGTIDAVTTGWRWPPGNNGPCPNRVWLNDGLGNFHESGQLLDEGQSHVHGLELVDINGDSCLDLVMGIQDNSRSGRIYLNDGNGVFVKGSNLGGAGGENLALADFDNDGDLDIFMAKSTPPCLVWLNDGTDTLRNSGVRLGSTCTWDAAAGDFNSDGKPDVFAPACFWNDNGLSPAPAMFWLNSTSSTNVQDTQDRSTNPNQFQLNQNFPNPFNPSTIIRYSLDRPSQIRLSVFDLRGRTVKMLVDSHHFAGEHLLVWNGTDDSNNPVSSGIYFYKLESGNYTFLKKMVLVR
jgi:hypothetical protein